MKGKWLWVFVGAAILQIIVSGLAIWEKFKMIDKNIILQVGLAIILVGSGIMYLVEKYKELRNKLQSVLLTIDSAEWGAMEQTRDVAHILWSKIIACRIENLPVTNDTFGPPDPAKGKPKILTVKYKYCGEPRSVSVPEGGTLSIP